MAVDYYRKSYGCGGRGIFSVVGRNDADSDELLEGPFSPGSLLGFRQACKLAYWGDRKLLSRVCAGAVIVLLVVLGAGCGEQGDRQMDREIKFGLLADAQYADKEAVGSRYYRNSKGKLVECVADLNDEGVEFAVQLGDIIEGGRDAATELDEMLEIYGAINGQTYHTMGNHDFAGIDRAAVLEKMALERGYYDFVVGRWRFVVLDTLDAALIGGWKEDSENYAAGKQMFERLKSEKAANAVNWNGGIGQEQKQWLAGVLDDAASKGEQVLAFGHCPLVPAGDVHNVWNAEEIAQMLENSKCVAAYFCGHNHHGSYELRNGVHYVTFKGMVETADTNAYAVVTLKGDTIVITGFGRTVSRVLRIGQ